MSTASANWRTPSSCSTRHFDQQFEDSDTLADDVISRLQVSGIASDEGIPEAGSSSSEAHEILRSKAGVLSYLGDISIFDSERRHDQLVAAAAGTRPQHFRAGPISRASNPIRDRHPF